MRVLITRPPEKAAPFAEALRAIGAQPVFLPTICIAPVEDPAPLDRALRRLRCYDWLAFTSVSGVEAVWERFAVLGVDSLPPALRVAAVGAKTRAALEERGVSPHFSPAEYRAEAILPGLGDLRGRWVLLPLADIAGGELPAAIARADGIAHVVTAYRTLPAVLDPTGLSALQQGVDVIAFTSGSTARNFVALTRNAGLDPFHLPGNPQIACIGPKTAAVAARLGFAVAVVAENYTVEGLVEAIGRAGMRVERYQVCR